MTTSKQSICHCVGYMKSVVRGMLIYANKIEIYKNSSLKLLELDASTDLLFLHTIHRFKENDPDNFLFPVFLDFLTEINTL